MSVSLDLTGQRFGRLVVVRYAGSDNGRIWLCSCDCGNKHRAKTGHLRAGVVASCGCAQQDAGRETARLYGHLRRKHGMSHTPLSGAYVNMMRRCYRPGTRRYERYGGRGIAVCDEWRGNQAAFIAWGLANGWAPGLSIERIDHDGNYEPGNCRWIPLAEQAGNTSRNRRLIWEGRTQTVSQWARELGVKPQALQHRLDRGWPVERIFTQPFREARA